MAPRVEIRPGAADAAAVEGAWLPTKTSGFCES